ncbi:DUF2505 domain-containing protein [Pedococcus sp. 5OH_020]|uniref:DUF2505 domain-containing protein n=1 Tax=Pedococcus sp. 5OH_020 TaxID=2989814 RepID=UPI0022E9EC20|nr:DUF2505 domain-containing protein [Pedococcus sp. 5OH_020]
MKIATTMEYDATPQEVFAVLSDKAFQEAKCAATAAVKYTAEVSSTADVTTIRTERVLPADALPDFAKNMVGQTLKVLETQTWGPAATDGSRTGKVEMSVAGVPVSLAGTLSLAPGASGTVETLDSELKAKVPLIGGKIEKAAAPPIQEAIAIEAATAKQWLRR